MYVNFPIRFKNQRNSSEATDAQNKEIRNQKPPSNCSLPVNVNILTIFMANSLNE